MSDIEKEIIKEFCVAAESIVYYMADGSHFQGTIAKKFNVDVAQVKKIVYRIASEVGQEIKDIRNEQRLSNLSVS